MKNKIIIILIIFIGFIFFSNAVFSIECKSSEGGVLPEISLPVPQNAIESDYLGLKGKGSFKITNIKADVVIIEIFSMYCPYCQKEAPNINNLYELIINNPDLKDKVKIIGIGANNTSYEVNFFKDQYKIQFPLFHDESRVIHTALEKSFGVLRTPYFFAIKINTDGSHKILYSQAGGIQEPKNFLDMIVKKSNLE